MCESEREKMLSSSVVTRSVRNRFFSNVSSADYVILGAGSAGCVLGSRLSEDGKDDVAVLGNVVSFVFEILETRMSHTNNPNKYNRGGTFGSEYLGLVENCHAQCFDI